jgi:isoleucyl-tRNA synthetase
MNWPEWPAGPADALEQNLLAQWKAEGLFQRVQAQGAGGKPFVFYEGPPTANGLPGIHHVFSRTIKDLVCRFRVMQGYEVTRIAGWDTHGLPVEIEVEKALALSGKKDIEAYGVEAFNALCRASVFTYKDDWEQLSDRIGYWLDYERPYVTCTPEYVESVWWLLRQLHGKSLLIRGHRVLPYCPRCGTVLSSHELALGYEDVTTNSVYVTVPLEGQPERQLLVWTTTPWTLLSNVAVAVHPDLEYGEYRLGERTVILATARAGLPSSAEKGAPSFADLGAERTFPGRELAGLRYERPLELVDLPTDRRSRVVITAEFVTADDGSGLVHLAPAFGADDHAAGQKHDLAMVRPVAADGTFEGTTWPELEGQLVTAKATNDLILQRLKRGGRWHLTQPHAHSYPHCWRCRSALIYYARDSWFVRTSAIKERMQELNAQVNWNPPEVGSGRFGEWLSNNVDWALSRDRYWGTPLPVWVSDTDPTVVEVIGSFAELAERSGRALPDDFDPHKPFIDAYTWPALDGGTMRRVPEVIDTWFDSGSMPVAQWHYPFENQELFARHFPADYICEGVDQTRGWFYSLLAIATGVFDTLPYRNVIVNDLVLDAQGQKMSKSRGNAVDPWAVLGDHGADSIRLYLLASGQVWLPKRFDPKLIAEVAGGPLMTLRNVYGFYRLYAGGERSAGQGGTPTEVLDEWVMSRLHATVDEVVSSWEGYDVTAGVRAIYAFLVDDLSNWYVRLSRARFWAPDREADPAAVAALHTCLVTISRLLAPAAPFVSDWLHRALEGGSVHLAAFPSAGGARNPSLEAAMDAVRRLASLARSAREEAGIRVRQPIARMRVAVPVSTETGRLTALLPLLAQEVNVRDIELVSSDADLVRLVARPDFRALGKRFGKRTPLVAAAAQQLDAEALRDLEAGGRVRVTTDGETAELSLEDVEVVREVVTDWVVGSHGPFVVALDPVLTPALRQEGLARELVSRVQRLRKEAGLDYADRITLFVDGPPELLHAVEAHADFIRGETLTRDLVLGPDAGSEPTRDTIHLDGLAARVAVRRHAAPSPNTEPQPMDAS